MRVGGNTSGKGLSITQILKKRAACDIRMEKGACSLTLRSEAANGRWRRETLSVTHWEKWFCVTHVLRDHMEPSSVTYRREEGLKVAHVRDRLYGSWEAGGSPGDISTSGSTTHER